jgi:hypothetical protein
VELEEVGMVICVSPESHCCLAFGVVPRCHLSDTGKDQDQSKSKLES